VHEVLLGDEYLMSSLFTVAEVELARLGLADVQGGQLDVVVGGLGLGYTARAVLADDRIRSLRVVEALDAVIDWHRLGLLPLSDVLTSDPRCRLVAGDFFAIAAGDVALDADAPDGFDAVLVDIDHSPQHVLHPTHAGFYRSEGLRSLTRLIRPGGAFALWSDDPPDAAFTAVLDEVFDDSTAHVVEFANPITGGQSANTVYVARRAAASP
jgi:spermidine synthase